MIKTRLIVLALASAVALAQDISVRSAASYAEAVSPNSLVAVFGSDLVAEPTVATLEDSGLLPTQLGGARLAIDGRPARLLFVSPGQMNALVPESIETGEASVEVTTSGGLLRRGTALVAGSSPSLFSLDSSGGGPGAVLNAVTGTGSPFLVQTEANLGSDPRTRLALFGTGIRNAEAVSVVALPDDGEPIALDVEFSGAAPGFFGLDQVNAVLPANLDDAGLISLQLRANELESNLVTIQIDPLTHVGRPTTPQPLFEHIETSAQLLNDCSGIPGQPSIPCVAFPLDHSWSPSSSPHGLAWYELDSALGPQVRVPPTETGFTQWRVDLSGAECSPEPVGQTFSWSVRAIDMLGHSSDASRIGIIEIGPCPD